MPNQPIPWHAVADEKVFFKLQTTLVGLDAQQVAERQIEFGRNTLPERKPPTLFDIILHQFKSPLIYILLLAFLLHIMATELPFLQSLLRPQSLSVEYWLYSLAIGSVILVVIEIYKKFSIRKI